MSSNGGWTPELYIASLWAYFENYAPKGGIWVHQWLCIHLWSLAVEQQFYLVWPPIFAMFLRCRLSPWVITLPLFAGVLVCRMISGADLEGRLETRGLAILFGCFVAALTAKGPQPWLNGIINRTAFRRGWLGATLLLFGILTVLSLSPESVDEQNVHDVVPTIHVPAVLRRRAFLLAWASGWH